MPKRETYKLPESERLEARKEIAYIIRTVPSEKGFHFYTLPGQFTGVTARSLEEFEKKLQEVNVHSIVFHFLRKDFQKWIKDVLGDNELAERINQIDTALPDERIQKTIVAFVQTRLTQLKRELPHNLSHEHS